jgi:outer membrane beta-barrel protein
MFYRKLIESLSVVRVNFSRNLSVLSRHTYVLCFGFALTTLVSAAATAETIEFPEEELATESVLPVFDKKMVVRERAIKTEGRIELGIGGGLNLAEPLYGQSVYNFGVGYHFTELHGVSLNGFFLNDELSTAGKDLKNGKGLPAGTTFEADLAPTVSSMYFLNYQLTAYYGKMSITKQTVMHLSLYGFMGAGLVEWTDVTEMALDLGLGQKLYFNQHLAFQLDLMMAIYQGPDPTSPKFNNGNLDDGLIHKSSEFDSTVYMRPFLTGSLAFLF